MAQALGVYISRGGTEKSGARVGVYKKSGARLGVYIRGWRKGCGVYMAQNWAHISKAPLGVYIIEILLSTIISYSMIFYSFY